MQEQKNTKHRFVGRADLLCDAASNVARRGVAVNTILNVLWTGKYMLRRYALELFLLSVLIAVWTITGISPPAGHLDWVLESGPGMLAVALLCATSGRFTFSRLVYVGVFLHCLVLTYGGYYTYALTPLGNWLRDLLHGQRNCYDRIGHLAQGVFPALFLRELLLRTSGLVRGKWLTALTIASCLAFSALYELFEWWTALVTSPEQGDAFLGTQGDVWDTQWDMFCCLIGATASATGLARLHDASMKRCFGAAAWL